MKLRLGKTPDDWSWEVSGDVIDVRDGTHDTPKYLPEGVPLVTSKNLKPYGIDFGNVGFISEEDHVAISKRSRVDRGDILFAMIGTIGNPVVVDNDREFSIKNIALFKCPKDRVDSRYCYRLLGSPLVKKQLDDASRGGTQKFVSLKVLRNLQIPLPPLVEQKRIAAILDAADALRAKRREALGQLDTLLHSTFLDMFGDPVTNPMGWEMVTIANAPLHIGDGNYSSKYPKASDFIDQGVPFIRANNISSNTVDGHDMKFISTEQHAELKKGHLRTGDVLITTRGDVGQVAIVPQEFDDANINAQLVLLRPKDPKILSTFLCHLLAASSMRQKIKSLETGVALKQLPIHNLRKVPLFLPPLDLQRRFAAIVESVERQKARMRTHLTELDTLFASLQSRAFNGDL